MVIVKIFSGPKAGQQNLTPIQPKELRMLSQHGWRWEVDWSTVPEDEVLVWAQQDLANKIVSALIRGGYVRFAKPEGTQEWRGQPDLELIGEIEDCIVYSGYIGFVSSDEEDGLVISVHSTEHPLQ